MSGLQRSAVHSNVTSDWRKCHPGRKAKLGYLLESNLFADVTFAIGPEKKNILAHKFILVMYSSVFEAMFNGYFTKNEEEGIVDVPDIEPNAFYSVLKYIYTGEFESDISTQDALGVLYAARKYEISELEEECTSYLNCHITEENAVSIFQTAQLLDVADLRDEVQSFLIRNFDNIIKLDDFLSITRENLCLFLENDDTNGCELDVFNGVLRWAVAECTKKDLEQSPENLRSVLQETLHLVRFPVMTSEDIALQVVPTGVLTPEECTLLFQHLVVSPDNRSLLPQTPFKSKKRNCSIYTVNFYEEVARSAYVDISAGWYNKFMVDQAISIISFGFYGPHFVDVASYDVNIKLLKDTSDNAVFAEAKQTVKANANEIFHVKFPKSVPINAATFYRAWFSLKGPLTCHGITNTPSQEIIVTVKGQRFRQVKFTYVITGAHQLPEIAFQI